MIIIKDGILPNRNPKDDLKRRSKDFEDAFNLDVSTGAVFETVNIRAWKTAFYAQLRKRFPDRKYTFAKRQKMSKRHYEIWRLR